MPPRTVPGRHCPGPRSMPRHRLEAYLSRLIPAAQILQHRERQRDQNTHTHTHICTHIYIYIDTSIYILISDYILHLIYTCRQVCMRVYVYIHVKKKKYNHRWMGTLSAHVQQGCFAGRHRSRGPALPSEGRSTLKARRARRVIPAAGSACSFDLQTAVPGCSRYLRRRI